METIGGEIKWIKEQKAIAKKYFRNQMNWGRDRELGKEEDQASYFDDSSR